VSRTDCGAHRHGKNKPFDADAHRTTPSSFQVNGRVIHPVNQSRA
jgi:hypothetical protein